jgi:capsular exopolysaccharide synthesis family protein
MSEHAINVHRLYHTQRIDPGPILPRELPPIDDAADEPDFDLRALFRVFRVRFWTIVGTIAICMAVAFVAVLQMTPLYTASALVLVGQRENKVVQDSVVADLTMDTSTIENQIQILRSSSLAERVVKKLNLARDREFGPGRQPWTAYLNPMNWLEEQAPKSRARAAVQAPTVDPALLKRFASRLTVAAQGRSSVIRVSFDSANREKAALIANAIVDQYIVAQLEMKADAAKRTTSWLDERLTQLTTELRKAEDAVEQYKAENDLEGKDGTTLAAEQVSELNSQIVLARSNLAEHEAKYKQVNALYRAGGTADSIAAVINSPLISTLRGQQAELVRKEAELSTKYGDRHPQMIALRDEKKNLDAKIEEEVKRIIKNLANEVAVARARLNSIETSLREMQGTTDTQGRASVKLRELQREAEARRLAVQQYQQNRTTTEGKEQVQKPDAQPIQTASVPLSPSFPNKPLIMGVTLFGSAVMGMLLALLIERLDNGFRTGGEIERLARVANLAVVPRLKGVRHVADRVMQKPLSAFSESIRSLLSGLQLSNVDRPPKVVLVTSSVPNEGKTSIAVSLGRLASRSGARVILIDGDLRHPSVALQFSPRRAEAGLVEVLAGKRDLASVLHRDPISPLEFVPVSAPPANPADLLGSVAMKKLIEFLRQYYDLIVIDAAPVLPVSDTRLLSRLADKVVYAVAWDSTPREAVLGGLKLLRDANADIAGTVLNLADMRRHAIYGYGSSSYGYGTKYTRYYAE